MKQAQYSPEWGEMAGGLGGWDRYTENEKVVLQDYVGNYVGNLGV